VSGPFVSGDRHVERRSVLAVLDIRVRVLALSVLLLAAHVPMAALLAVSVIAPASFRPSPDIPGVAAGLDGMCPLSALSPLPPTALLLLFDPALSFVLLPDAPLLLTGLPYVALSLPALLTVLPLLSLVLLALLTLLCLVLRLLALLVRSV